MLANQDSKFHKFAGSVVHTPIHCKPHVARDPLLVESTWEHYPTKVTNGDKNCDRWGGLEQ